MSTANLFSLLETRTGSIEKAHEILSTAESKDRIRDVEIMLILGAGHAEIMKELK